MQSGALYKPEYEKLPKIGSSRDNHDDKNALKCLVPIIEGTKTVERTSDNEAKKYNNSIPDDLILSIKQAENPREYLGPSKRTLAGIRPTIPGVTKKPDNAWNYEKQREKFKFLTDQPICSCGAGKDISFMYDCVMHGPSVKQPAPSKNDPSSVRVPSNPDSQQQDNSAHLPDSIVPDEYRIVKNQGVWPLKIEENAHATVPEDHYNHVTVFPSLKPVGRMEVIQLKHTMDALLKRVGADVIDQRGPTQLHNLLEIIKQEQDIYNIVFHEIIRQVTVECKERGEILAKLRERYANLLSRVPREIKSLHEEVIAQRALDRRLTEELTQFKTKIAMLTDELSKVKAHDKHISDQALAYQKDLEKALGDAQKNASLLEEYHDLYELQRKRLEKSIMLLTDEREAWTRAAYSIALKITEENKLNTAKRLNIAEQSWFKLATHFSIFLSDKDTKELSKVQSLVDDWKEALNEIRSEVFKSESNQTKSLKTIGSNLEQLRSTLDAKSFEQGRLVAIPDITKIGVLHLQLKHLIESLHQEVDSFNGTVAVENDEKLQKCDRSVYNLMKLCNRITSRHEPSKDNEKYQQYMKYEKLQHDMKKLHEQYRLRNSGENGLSKILTLVINNLDVWLQKFHTQIQYENSGKAGKVKLTEQEWSAFYQSIDDWLDHIAKAEALIGRSSPDELQLAEDGKPLARLVDHDDLFNQVHQWLTALNHFVDSLDAFVAEQSAQIHLRMVHWYIQVLIRLAPDQEEISDEGRYSIYSWTDSIERLIEVSHDLKDAILHFTNSLVASCSALTSEEDINHVPASSEEFDKESKNLKKLQLDCQEWMSSVKLLIEELKTVNNIDFYDQVSNEGGSEYGDEENEDATLNQDAVEDNPAIEDQRESREARREVKIEEDENAGEVSNIERVLPVADATPDHIEEKAVSPVKARSQPQSSAAKPNSYEILATDLNTERRFLDDINLTTSNELTEEELRSKVFNASHTIHKLQEDLFKTEERAQRNESKVAELSMKLKEALEKIREYEKLGVEAVALANQSTASQQTLASNKEEDSLPSGQFINETADQANPMTPSKNSSRKTDTKSKPKKK